MYKERAFWWRQRSVYHQSSVDPSLKVCFTKPCLFFRLLFQSFSLPCEILQSFFKASENYSNLTTWEEKITFWLNCSQLVDVRLVTKGHKETLLHSKRSQVRKKRLRSTDLHTKKILTRPLKNPWCLYKAALLPNVVQTFCFLSISVTFLRETMHNKVLI